MSQGVITEVGREKLCKSHAGDRMLPIITEMAFGDGGIDENENVLTPSGNEIALKNALLHKTLDGHTYPLSTTCRYTVRLEKQELANKMISEIGLYDAEGDLVAYKTCLPKGKDDDMEFVFDMDEIF